MISLTVMPERYCPKKRLENSHCQPSSNYVSVLNQGTIGQRKKRAGLCLPCAVPNIHGGSKPNPLPIWSLGYRKPLSFTTNKVYKQFF